MNLEVHKSGDIAIFLYSCQIYLPIDLGLLITVCYMVVIIGKTSQSCKCKWTEVVGQLATDVQTMDVSNTLNQYITRVMT